MDSILIQVILLNNRDFSIDNQILFKSRLSCILQNKFYISHKKVNKVYYLDLLYCRDSRVVFTKESIVNIIRNIFFSVQRVYITIISRPIEN